MNSKYHQARSRLFSLIPSLISILLACLVSSIILLLSGHDPIEAFTSLAVGAFGNSYRFSETLVKAIPITVIALGTSVAFKAQLWNIGGNSQYTIGAIVAVAVSIYLDLPPVFLVVLSFLAALAAGLVFGAFLGAMKARLNVNEVITTLMFDYIIAFLLSWLVYGPMMDPEGFGFPQTALIPKAVMFTKLIANSRLHGGLFVALLLVVFLFLFWKTPQGFSITMVGQSRTVAKASGVKVSKTIIITMALSAGFAAMAGWIDALGIHGRLQDNLAGSLGSVAIVVALLGRLHPIGIAVSALFFSALIVGGNTMQRFVGVPFSLVTIIQGLVIIFVICSNMFEHIWHKKRGGVQHD
jgi:simple sugar transport system permease protein